MKVQSMTANHSLFCTPQHAASCAIKIITTCIVIFFHPPCWIVIFKKGLFYFKPQEDSTEPGKQWAVKL